MNNIIYFPGKEDWKEIFSRPVLDFSKIENLVLPILEDVKKQGDAALKHYTKQFDKCELQTLKVDEEELLNAEEQVPEELKKAIQQARINIEKFHLAQREQFRQIETSAGVVCWRKSVPISKVGLYIPGGSAPLFSTILMLAIPAIIAGCEEIILCSPPNQEGKLHPAILFTCSLLGIHKIFKAGGAQAIAAMAYGTETIPSVYKIFGPGNQFVTAAKQLVNKEGVAIDMPAGPSEVAVVGDETCRPDFVAADLLSQAEHGPDSQVIFISDKEEVVQKVLKETKLQLEALPRKDVAAQALGNSRFIVADNINEALKMINFYAPEHLILQVKEAKTIAGQVVNAGSVFIGNYTPEAAGDYASGTNHTLPTNGYARAYAGVSLDSFVKKITFQKITEEGLKSIGPVIEIMAEAEALHAHKRAVSIRLKA